MSDINSDIRKNGILSSNIYSAQEKKVDIPNTNVSKEPENKPSTSLNMNPVYLSNLAGIGLKLPNAGKDTDVDIILRNLKLPQDRLERFQKLCTDVVLKKINSGEFASKLAGKAYQDMHPIEFIAELTTVYDDSQIDAVKTVLESDNKTLPHLLNAPILREHPENINRLCKFTERHQGKKEFIDNAVISYFTTEDQFNFVMSTIETNPDISPEKLHKRFIEYTSAREKIMQKIKDLGFFEQIMDYCSLNTEQPDIEKMNKLTNAFNNLANTGDIGLCQMIFVGVGEDEKISLKSLLAINKCLEKGYSPQETKGIVEAGQVRSSKVPVYGELSDELFEKAFELVDEHGFDTYNLYNITRNISKNHDKVNPKKYEAIFKLLENGVERNNISTLLPNSDADGYIETLIEFKNKHNISITRSNDILSGCCIKDKDDNTVLYSEMISKADELLKKGYDSYEISSLLTLGIFNNKFDEKLFNFAIKMYENGFTDTWDISNIFSNFTIESDEEKVFDYNAENIIDRFIEAGVKPKDIFYIIGKCYDYNEDKMDYKKLNISLELCELGKSANDVNGLLSSFNIRNFDKEDTLNNLNQVLKLVKSGYKGEIKIAQYIMNSSKIIEEDTVDQIIEQRQKNNISDEKLYLYLSNSTVSNEFKMEKFLENIHIGEFLTEDSHFKDITYLINNNNVVKEHVISYLENGGNYEDLSTVRSACYYFSSSSSFDSISFLNILQHLQEHPDSSKEVIYDLNGILYAANDKQSVINQKALKFGLNNSSICSKLLYACKSSNGSFVDNRLDFLSKLDIAKLTDVDDVLKFISNLYNDDSSEKLPEEVENTLITMLEKNMVTSEFAFSQILHSEGAKEDLDTIIKSFDEGILTQDDVKDITNIISRTNVENAEFGIKECLSNKRGIKILKFLNNNNNISRSVDKDLYNEINNLFEHGLNERYIEQLGSYVYKRNIASDKQDYIQGIQNWISEIDLSNLPEKVSFTHIMKMAEHKLTQNDIDEYCKVLRLAEENNLEIDFPVERFKDITPIKSEIAIQLIKEGATNSVPMDYPDIAGKLMNRGLSIDNVDYKKLVKILDSGEDGKSLTPNQEELLLDLTKYSSNLSGINNEIMSNISEEDISKIRNILNSNPPEVVKNILREILCKPDKSAVLLERPDLVNEVNKSFFDEDSISLDVWTDSLRSLPYLPEKTTEKLTSPLNKLFEIELAARVGYLDSKYIGQGERIAKLINKVAEVEDANRANNLLDLLFDCDEREIFLQDDSINMDFLIERLNNKNISINNRDISRILSTNVDLKENEKIVQDIKSRKDFILKEMKLRCKDNCPDFVDWIESFIDSDEFYDLMYVEDISPEVLIRNLTETSKIFASVNSNPQNFINGQYSSSVIDALKEMRSPKSNSNGKYEKLSEDEQRQVQYLDENISTYMNDNLLLIFKAISSTDKETVQLLLDKRFDAFKESLNEVNDLSPNSKNILSDIIRNGKRINKKGAPDKLTGQQKIDLIKLIKFTEDISVNTGKPFDFSKYKTPVDKKSYVFNIDSLRLNMFQEILLSLGIAEDEIDKFNDEDLNWDNRYVSLLSKAPSKDTGELSTVIIEASKGHFQEFIRDVSNPHGQANFETQNEFEELGLNYDNWQTGPEKRTFTVGDKEYSIKLWNRNPQESIFDGSYATCCTALDGCNGGSMANFLLNTAINVVEIKDDKENTVGFSRCFMGKLDGRTTLVMENIELNNGVYSTIVSDGDITELTDEIFSYMKDFATSVGGEDTPVYMSTSYHKIGNKPFEQFDVENKKVTFIGKISKPELYLNTYKGYVDTSSLVDKPAEFHVIKR